MTVQTVPGPRPSAVPASPAGLVVDGQRDQQSLWVEVRWNTM